LCRVGCLFLAGCCCKCTVRSATKRGIDVYAVSGNAGRRWADVSAVARCPPRAGPTVAAVRIARRSRSRCGPDPSNRQITKGHAPPLDLPWRSNSSRTAGARSTRPSLDHAGDVFETAHSSKDPTSPVNPKQPKRSPSTTLTSAQKGCWQVLMRTDSLRPLIVDCSARKAASSLVGAIADSCGSPEI
jgi:hypothetical protein